MIIQVLRLDSRQQRTEPFKRVEITTDPEEVDLPETSLLLGIVHPVPDTLQDRGERGHADTGADQRHHLILEHVFGRAAEWSVDVQTWKNLTQRRVDLVTARDPIDPDHGG